MRELGAQTLAAAEFEVESNRTRAKRLGVNEVDTKEHQPKKRKLPVFRGSCWTVATGLAAICLLPSLSRANQQGHPVSQQSKSRRRKIS